MDIRSDRIEAYDGPDSLKLLYEILRRQKILDSARSEMLRGLEEGTITFRLNKQAALMGFVSFPAEEEPLGSIHVKITGGERVLDWLAPKTENGIPVIEMDLAELVGRRESESLDEIALKGVAEDRREALDV